MTEVEFFILNSPSSNNYLILNSPKFFGFCWYNRNTSQSQNLVSLKYYFLFLAYCLYTSFSHRLIILSIRTPWTLLWKSSTVFIKTNFLPFLWWFAFQTTIFFNIFLEYFQYSHFCSLYPPALTYIQLSIPHSST